MEKKNFGLSANAFQALVTALKAGDETLYEKIFLAHFQDCRKYLQHKFQASQEDAYDATMDAMVVFCNRLKADKIQYGNLRFLFTQIAGQIYVRWIKKEQLKTTLTQMDLPTPNATIDKKALQLLNKAWTLLGENCAELLKAFYYGGVPLQEIALQNEKSPAAIRKQKQRCVEQLRHLFLKVS